MLGIFVGGRVEFYRLANKILHILHNTGLLNCDIDKILDIIRQIQQDLESRKQDIYSLEASPLDYSSPSEDDETCHKLSDSQTNPIFGRFARAVLSNFSARPHAIILGPVRRSGLEAYLRETEPK